MPPSSILPDPFRVEIPQAKLDDLRRRLENVNWPHDFENEDWEYGVAAPYLRELVEYWRDGFDWRAQEDSINAHAHFRTEIDEVPIHFIHERGRGPNPIPIVMSHGWPWTFWDFKDVIGPLVVMEMAEFAELGEHQIVSEAGAPPGRRV